MVFGINRVSYETFEKNDNPLPPFIHNQKHRTYLRVGDTSWLCVRRGRLALQRAGGSRVTSMDVARETIITTSSEGGESEWNLVNSGGKRGQEEHKGLEPVEPAGAKGFIRTLVTRTSLGANYAYPTHQ